MDRKFAIVVAGSILVSIGVVTCINVFVDAVYPVSPEPGRGTRNSLSAPVTSEPPKALAADAPATKPADAPKPDQLSRDQQPSRELLERLAAASAEAGQLAARKCTICHTFDKGGPNRTGPSLYGIVSAPVGNQEGFPYSAVMKKHGGNWDYELLDCYIGNTKTCMPGTKMIFAGVKNAAERANIIVFLRLLADNPAPLTSP